MRIAGLAAGIVLTIIGGGLSVGAVFPGPLLLMAGLGLCWACQGPADAVTP